MTDNGTGQRAKGRRVRSKKEPVLGGNTKKLLLCLSVGCICWKKKKENSVHELLPPAHAEVKCKMHGRMRVAGRGEAMQMLMQALECSYRLMQPLSPVVPAHLLKAKNTF